MNLTTPSLTSLDLNKLLTFLEIAEAGGVTPAARQLGVTRSAVSHSLAALERSLGLPLFHRIGKRLVLTREGAALRSSLGDTRDRLQAALGQALGAAGEVRGQIRIGLFLGFSRFRLAGVIEDFIAEHAEARVRVAFGPEAWLHEQLLEGKLDFSVSLRSAATPKLRSEKLFEQSLVLAVQRLRRRGPPSLDELGDLSFVDYYQSDPLIDRWLKHQYRRRRLPRRRVRVWAASTDLALELVLSGVGAAVLPEDVVQPFRRAKDLHVIPGPRGPLRDAVWLNELQGARSNPTHAAFRQQLLASLAGASG